MNIKLQAFPVEFAEANPGDAIDVCEHALQRMLDRFAPTLRQAAELVAAPPVQPSASADEKASPAVPEPAPPPIQPEAVAPAAAPPQAPSRAAMRFQAVKQLKQQGISEHAIAQQLGLNRRTVRRYSVHETIPVLTSMPHPPSILLPFVDYLQRRLQDGCDNRTQLHQELTALGFTGSYHTVWSATQQLLPLAQAQRPAPPPPIRLLSSRQAAWLLVRRSDQLKPEEKQLLAALCGSSEPITTAHQLTQAFYRMVRERKADEFDPWLASAQQADIPELQRFAEGLAQDYDAVKAALTEHLSNGPVEGHINKLTLVKRQMFGRGKLDLLRQRLLHAM